ATSGSSAITAIELKKKQTTRAITIRTRGDWRTCWTPTRIAPEIRSFGNVLGFLRYGHAKSSAAAIADSVAVSANAQAGPYVAMTTPASSGPTMRDPLFAT